MFFWCFESMFTFSVMIISTHCLPVNGRLHFDRILWLPSLALCSMVTMTFVPGAATKSMAPPMPFTNLPCFQKHWTWLFWRYRILKRMNITGIIQLAKSPYWDTSIAPSTVISTWPPRIMPKLSSELKYEAPGTTVTVSLPALMSSGSTYMYNENRCVKEGQ